MTCLLFSNNQPSETCLKFIEKAYYQPSLTYLATHLKLRKSYFFAACNNTLVKLKMGAAFYTLAVQAIPYSSSTVLVDTQSNFHGLFPPDTGTDAASPPKGVASLSTLHTQPMKLRICVKMASELPLSLNSR